MDKKPEQKEAAQQPEAQTEVAPVSITDNSPSEKATTSLFPELETEKPKEEAPTLRRVLITARRNAPA